MSTFHGRKKRNYSELQREEELAQNLERKMDVSCSGWGWVGGERKRGPMLRFGESKERAGVPHVLALFLRVPSRKELGTVAGHWKVSGKSCGVVWRGGPEVCHHDRKPGP